MKSICAEAQNNHSNSVVGLKSLPLPAMVFGSMCVPQTLDFELGPRIFFDLDIWETTILCPTFRSLTLKGLKDFCLPYCISASASEVNDMLSLAASLKRMKDYEIRSDPAVGRRATLPNPAQPSSTKPQMTHKHVSNNK